MRVCLLVSELFDWGKYSGYGSYARRLGNGLAKRGLDVIAVVPRRPGQPLEARLDGMTVFSFSGWQVLNEYIYRKADADIYHSIEASLATIGAMRAMPRRKHMITALDPWTWRDWTIELAYAARESLSRCLIFPLLWGYYSPIVLGRAVRRTHAVYTQARYLSEKVRHIYHLANKPGYLPNPYPVPSLRPVKSTRPTVCYLARWDPRKRPQIFFELAKRFPNVRFIAMGMAQNKHLDATLRARYADIPNLEMTGFINSFKSRQIDNILDDSWIMVNTAAREGLPIAFTEAAAHQCAILSAVDADGFASRGGCNVKIGSSNRLSELGGQYAIVDDYAEGLEWLLENDHWREKGEEGFSYVQSVHSEQKALSAHLAAYQLLFEQ